jgi:hypothetical protein
MEEGDIKIPAFQRGFVWKQNQVIDLLDSIYNDYPIGSILLWNSNDRLKSSRNIGGFEIPERDDQYPVNYVLDGQQRLSAIYGTFCKNRTLAPENERYKVDPSIFNIYFDLDDDRFAHDTDVNLEHRNFPAAYLFDIEDFVKGVQGYPSHLKAKAQHLLSKFQNYEVPVVTTSKRTKEEVGIIFERINNTGTRLTTLDLMIAWTWSEDFHLREKIDEILDILDQKGFGDVDDKIILQCLSAIIKKTTKTKDILALEPDEVKVNIASLQDALEKAVDFFATQLHIVTTDFLPQSHQLIPIAYFFSRINNPSANQLKTLKQWFWRTSFSLRYSGATDTRLNQDIDLIDRIAQGEQEIPQRYGQLPPDKILIGAPFTRTNVYTRSLLLLMAQAKPLNLINGANVDIGVALSKYNSKEYHHIFPRAFLKDRGVDVDRINSVCNFCFLPSDSNKKISRKAPSDYVFNLIPPHLYDRIMSSNLLPLDKDIYEKDDYDIFLKRRAEVVLKFLADQAS